MASSIGSLIDSATMSDDDMAHSSSGFSPLKSAPSFSSLVTDTSAESDKPPPRDLTHLYSETTKLRVPNKMKQYYKFFQVPGAGNLAGGLPNVRYFPYDTLEAQIAKPVRWTPSPNRQGTEDGDDGEDDAVLVADRVAAVNLSVPDADVAASSSSSSSPADRLAPAHLLVPKVTPANAPTVSPEKKIDLASALQYGTVDGYPPLLTWVRHFTREYLHPNVPYRGGPDVILTVGSTDGFHKFVELFVDAWVPGRDDVRNRPGLLCEEFVYANVLGQIAPKGAQVVTVKADNDGMLAYGPGSLEDVLASWDESKGRRPHIMYTVTMGHNPTGYLLGIERRKQLYAVCSQFDVVIAEDDPYWYLQYPSAAVNEAASRNYAKPKGQIVVPSLEGKKSSGFTFLDSLVPSYLSIDVDGRVVRIDTFSKTVAPGCRLGWLTAQPALIERFTRIAETTTSQPSGFVQALISELVMGPLPADLPPLSSASDSGKSGKNGKNGKSSNKGGETAPAFAGWQFAGWVRWLEGLRGEYERRMNRMCTLLDEGSFQLKQGTPVRPADADWGVITKTQILSFDWPRGGMFIWVRVHFEAHPLWLAPRTDPGQEGEVLDGTALSMALLLYLVNKPNLVVISPGAMFSANDEVRLAKGWAYYRLCFAAESQENIELCTQRLIAGVHKFWKIKRVAEIEDIIRDSPVAVAENAAEADEACALGNLGTYMGC